jgi:hypothetical protein
MLKFYYHPAPFIFGEGAWESRRFLFPTLAAMSAKA